MPEPTSPREQASLNSHTHLAAPASEEDASAASAGLTPPAPPTTTESCLLMPREMICAAWEDFWGDRHRRVLRPLRPVDHPFVEISRGTDRLNGVGMRESEDRTLGRASRGLAWRFGLSTVAMRIRLERLGLLLRSVPTQPLPAIG